MTLISLGHGIQHWPLENMAYGTGLVRTWHTALTSWGHGIWCWQREKIDCCFEDTRRWYFMTKRAASVICRDTILRDKKSEPWCIDVQTWHYMTPRVDLSWCLKDRIRPKVRQRSKGRFAQPCEYRNLLNSTDEEAKLGVCVCVCNHDKKMTSTCAL